MEGQSEIISQSDNYQTVYKAEIRWRRAQLETSNLQVNTTVDLSLFLSRIMLIYLHKRSIKTQ